MKQHYPPFTFNGTTVYVKDAQEQMRTPRDVKGPWVRPRCPSKLAGRKGTRRGWKRKNAPHRVWLFREPTDVVVFDHGVVVVTPKQWHKIQGATKGQ